MQDDAVFRHAMFRVPQVAAWLYRGSFSAEEGERYSDSALRALWMASSTSGNLVYQSRQILQLFPQSFRLMIAPAVSLIGHRLEGEEWRDRNAHP